MEIVFDESMDTSILQVDDDGHLNESKSEITDIDSAMDLTPGQKSQKRKAEETNTSELLKQAENVVLDKISSKTDTIHDTTTESTEESKVEEGKVIKLKLSELSAKQRLEMRAKKFGAPIIVDAKKADRAARFGISNSNTNKITSSNSTTKFDALKQTAERFGANVFSAITKLNNKERIKRRQERFGFVYTSGIQNRAQERLRRIRQAV